jgi:PAS domain S-box-containing protein
MGLEARRSEVPAEIAEVWQRIVDSLSSTLSVPSVMVNRFDSNEIEVFRSSRQNPDLFPSGTRMPLLGVYCEATARMRQAYRVEDGRTDPVWSDSASVKNGIVSYLGYPLFWPDGRLFGTVCAVDTKANKWVSPSDNLLRTVRNAIEAHLAFIAATEELGVVDQEPERSETSHLRLFQPLEEEVAFSELFDLSELQRLQDLCAEAWGVASLITHPDGTAITRPSNFCRFCTIIRKSPKGRSICERSDAMAGSHNTAGPIIQKCLSAGLSLAGASITVGGRHVANWLIGQVTDGAETEERMAAYARRLGADEAELREAFRTVPVMPQERFEKTAHALFALANQLSATAYQNVQQKKLISAREEAEEALRENEERLIGITDNMPGVICRFYLKDDGELGMSYASGRILELFGLPADVTDNASSATLEHVHAEDRDRLIGSLRESADTLNPWGFEGRFVKASGEVVWFQGQASPKRLQDRTVFDGMLLDITDRKRAEEKSRETEIAYRALLDSLPVAVVMDDPGGTIKYASPQAMRLFGLDSLKDIVGRYAGERVAPESMEEAKRDMKRLRAGEYVPPREIVMLRKDGSRFHAEVYKSILRDASGQIEGAIHVTRDITERRRLEDERRKLEHELSNSQKMDAIGQLAGGLAHDFNNILMGILGNASLLQMEYNPEHPYYQKLSRIEEHVKRGADLTKQLLGFAREGKYEVRVLPINDLIKKSAKLFVETRKEIKAEFRLAEDAYSVEADAGQIGQVLLNIFINAAHAMPEGGKLHVETCNVTMREEDVRAFEIPAGDFVKISISDTGVGMAREVLGRVFEPFFTTKSHQGGTGLGLASAYGIIRNHGGAIKAYSEPGHGSTFVIYLPSTEKTTTAGDQARDTRLVAGSGGILLVDDEQMVRNCASEILQYLGYTVYQAENGTEAVATYLEKQKNIDLVILDMILPGTSGSQVLKTLRGINPGVKVILSSGYGLQGDVQKVVESGCLDFIQKPYVFTELSQIVQRIMQGKSRAEADGSNGSIH